MVENEKSIDLVELLKFLRTKIILIVFIALGVSMLVYGFLLTINDYYTSSARLTIAEQQAAPSGSSNSLMSSFSGGFGFAMNPVNDKVSEVQEIILSRDFIGHLLSKPGIYDKIVHATSYDKNNNELTFSENYSPTTSDKIQPRSLSRDQKFFTGFSKFKKNFEFIMNLESSYYTISYNHISPEFSEQLLHLIIQELNLLQKETAIAEANAALKYLENEMLKSTNAEVRGSIAKLIEMQLKTKMIANMRQDYLVKVIDTPYKPVSKTGPLRGFIASISFFITLFLLIPIFTFIFSRHKQV